MKTFQSNAKRLHFPNFPNMSTCRPKTLTKPSRTVLMWEYCRVGPPLIRSSIPLRVAPLIEFSLWAIFNVYLHQQIFTAEAHLLSSLFIFPSFLQRAASITSQPIIPESVACSRWLIYLLVAVMFALALPPAISLGRVCFGVKTDCVCRWLVGANDRVISRVGGTWVCEGRR